MTVTTVSPVLLSGCHRLSHCFSCKGFRRGWRPGPPAPQYPVHMKSVPDLLRGSASWRAPLYLALSTCLRRDRDGRADPGSARAMVGARGDPAVLVRAGTLVPASPRR